jgi:beta-N-acetylhexosaminidase
MIIRIGLFIGTMFLSQLGCAQVAADFRDARDRWVDSMMMTLDHDKKIGQLLMLKVEGVETWNEAEKSIRRNELGGALFTKGGPGILTHFINDIQADRDFPLFTALYADGGLGARLDSTLTFPDYATLGAVPDAGWLYKTGYEIGRQMRVLGINTVITSIPNMCLKQSGGAVHENKNQVSERSVQFVKGLQQQGLFVIAGTPGISSDLLTVTLPEVADLPYSQLYLDTLLTVPYRALADAGLQGMLIGPARFSQIDLDPGVSAPISPTFFENFITKGTEFSGLVFSGPIETVGLNAGKSNEEAVVAAWLAGTDVAIISDDVNINKGWLRRELRRNGKDEEWLETKVRKVLQAKFDQMLDKHPPTNPENLHLRLNPASNAVLQQRLFEQALTLPRSKGGLVPFHVIDTLHFATYSFEVEPTQEFRRILDKYATFYHYAFDRDNLLSTLEAYDVTVVPLLPGEWEVGEKMNFLRKLQQVTTLVLVLFDHPQALKVLEGFQHVMVAYEPHELNQRLAAQALFGAIPTPGNLPVTISNGFRAGQGIHPPTLQRLSYSLPEDVGMDGKILSKIDRIVEEAILEEAAPGAQLLIARHGKIVYEKTFGHFSYNRQKEVDDYTIYDVASITKVAATLQTIMFLVDNKLIDLDKKASVYLPELRNSNKKDIIIRDILTHHAGLWPFLPFWVQTMVKNDYLPQYYNYHPQEGNEYQISDGLYPTLATRDSVWQWVINSKMRPKQGRQPYDYKYSDMGYYILQRIAETVLNQPMEVFLQQNIYDPMGMSTTGYLPLCNFDFHRIAPTEDDKLFRKSLLTGWVHDQGAALVGGVAGHAGLFSNAIDLAKLMQMHLNGGHYGGVTFFHEPTVREFARRQGTSSRRGIGWDKPSLGEGPTPTSAFASPKTFGHTGFTGTAAWADPEFGLVYIFLSNRVHPNADNNKLIKANTRTRVMDVIYQSIFAFDQYKPVATTKEP